jgi:hypothetical protein
MRTVRVLLASFLVPLMLIGYATAATATPQSLNCLGTISNSKVERQENVSRIISDMHRQRLTADQISQTLQQNCGIERKSKPISTFAPSSTNQDIDVRPPDIFYDHGITEWYVEASFMWPQNFNFFSEIPFGCLSPCNVGGSDGFGIALSRPVLAVDPTRSYNILIHDWNLYWPYTYMDTPSDANTTGVAFVGQDKYCFSNQGSNCGAENGGSAYSWAFADLFYFIEDIGCGTIQAFAKYAHSWSSTSVNGIGVGPWSLNVQWSSSADRWEAVGPPSVAQHPC